MASLLANQNLEAQCHYIILLITRLFNDAQFQNGPDEVNKSVNWVKFMIEAGISHFVMTSKPVLRKTMSPIERNGVPE
jgi:hypothetical protein